MDIIQDMLSLFPHKRPDAKDILKNEAFTEYKQIIKHVAKIELPISERCIKINKSPKQLQIRDAIIDWINDKWNDEFFNARIAFTIIQVCDIYLYKKNPSINKHLICSAIIFFCIKYHNGLQECYPLKKIISYFTDYKSEYINRIIEIEYDVLSVTEFTLNDINPYEAMRLIDDKLSQNINVQKLFEWYVDIDNSRNKYPTDVLTEFINSKYYGK